MSSSTQPKKQHNVEEEEDIDELDDVLDEFNSKPTTSGSTQDQQSSSSTISTSQPQSSQSKESTQPQVSTTTSSQGQNPEEDGLPSDFDDILSQQFAKELAKGMQDMFGNQSGDATANKQGEAKGVEDDPSQQLSEEELMKQFEKIMAEMGLDGESSNQAASASQPTQSQQSTAAPANFQDAIKSTMSRLRESNASNASGGGAGAGGPNPFGDFSEEDMAKLLAGLGGDGGIPEGEEGMANMLEKMMGELMSKEVLHEPLKELRDKYPPYLASPPKDVTSEDMSRYQEQYDCVKQVVDIFENPEFDNGSEPKKAELKKKVSDLMAKMQDAGAPPKEVVGDMPAELENIPGFGGGNTNGNEEECLVM
ncbi:unnamed protein product [Sympodiomycopsis kandeliae]